MQSIPRIALITGAASGVGKATAKLLLSKGYKVACCDYSFIHHTPDRDLFEYFNGGANTLFCGMDTVNSDSVQSTLQIIKSTYGYAPSVVINTEKVLLDDDLLDPAKDPTPDPLDNLRVTLERNVMGCFNLARLASREMITNPVPSSGERGVIINRSSLAATSGSGVMVGYCAAMGAISSMTLPLARYLGRSGIRCVDIQSGLINTPDAQTYEDTVNVLSHMSPFPKRLGEPEEYADLVYSIINNPMLNGCSIRLDGGARF